MHSFKQLDQVEQANICAIVEMLCHEHAISEAEAYQHAEILAGALLDAKNSEHSVGSIFVEYACNGYTYTAQLHLHNELME